MSFLSFLFGNKDKRVLRQLGSVVNSINNLEEQFESLSDEELKNITSKLKEKLSEGSSLKELMPEAFAAVREIKQKILKSSSLRLSINWWRYFKSRHDC